MLKITNLTKIFNGQMVLNGINLTIKPGEVVAIIGPSGGGKSTLLRCVNGLDKADEGEISLFGEHRVGMVFQQFNLFHNMNLLRNLVYPQVAVLGRSLQESEARAREMLKVMNLHGLEDKMPKHLSGGQKQRGAIARTLCMDPSMVLFDEPTSALDPENVREVLAAIKQVAAAGITTLLVTHEMSFARDVASRIIFLDQGCVLEDASAKQFFSKPKAARAKSFLENVL